MDLTELSENVRKFLAAKYQQIKQSPYGRVATAAQPQNFFRPQTGTLATAGRKIFQTPIPQQVQQPVNQNLGKFFQNPVAQFGAGLVSGGNWGFAGSPAPAPISPTGKIAFGVGSTIGSFNPKNLPIKILGVVGKLGEAAVKTTLTPATAKLFRVVAPAVGREVAQTAAYGGASKLTGKPFNPKTDLAMGLGVSAGFGTVGKLARFGKLYNSDIKEVRDLYVKLKSAEKGGQMDIDTLTQAEKSIGAMAKAYKMFTQDTKKQWEKLPVLEKLKQLASKQMDLRAYGEPIKQGIMSEQDMMEKELAAEMKGYNAGQDKYGDYAAVVSKFKNFLGIAGEKKSKQTGELFREHIPRSVAGISSDEVADALGKSENEFMAELTADLSIMSSGKATQATVTRFKTNIKKIKTIYDKLDPVAFKPLKDEIGKIIGVAAEPTAKVTANIKLRNVKAEAQTAKQDFEAWKKQFYTQEGIKPIGQQIAGITGQMKQATKSPISDVTNLQDISGFEGQNKDVYRNFQKVYGKNIGQVKSMLLDPFDAAKGKFIKNLEGWANELDTNVVKKFGFKKGSPESAAIQQFGEGQLKQKDLVIQFGKEKADNIINADNWFRTQYDRLLSEVNAVRAKIYPGQTDKIIPKRQDYYRHFREMAKGIGGLINIFDSPANIQSSLSGISEFTKPKAKWLSFAQRRLGGATDIDAIGGFIDYVKAAEYTKNIDPHIGKFRALADELAASTETGGKNAGKLNNFIEYLHDFSNDLSGKTNPADRFVQKVVGRKVFRAVNWLNNRVKANVILGNLSSSVAQIFNVPQGIANAGLSNSVRGLGSTIANIFGETTPISKSNFIKERYGGNVFDRFDTGMINNTRKMAVWLVQALDDVGTRYIWNSHYAKALAENIANPIKYADDITRSMVAGRGIGEVPLLQKSRLFQLIAPFQLEVANSWYVMGDWVSAKQFGKIATFFLASYIFNRGAKAIRGSDVSFDPINASVDAYNAYKEEEDKKIGFMRAGGRLAGEVFSNVPLGQTAAAVYPEYGTKVGNTQLPTRRELFGQGDPTRFGSGLLAIKGLQDPLYKVVLPFGGQQLKRSITGVKTIGRGYGESKSGMVQTPVAQLYKIGRAHV